MAKRQRTDRGTPWVKNPKRFLAASALALALPFVACHGGGDENGLTWAKLKANVHAAGTHERFDGYYNMYHEAVAWENGPSKKLAGRPYSEAHSVFVSGGDVYVAGSDSDHQFADSRRAVLWVNGAIQDLSGEGCPYAEARSVYVSNGRVYVAGFKRERWPNDHTESATLWVDGQERVLGVGGLSSVFVSPSGEVYAAGYYRDEGYRRRPGLWKDGEAQRLQLLHENSEGEVDSIFVSGQDVYAVGYDNAGYGYETIWRNGSRRSIAGNYPVGPLSVFVSGQDVYVAGNDFDSSDKCRATVWKNGAPKFLGDGVENSMALSVFVLDGDVYVAGRSGGDYYHEARAALWVNGRELRLDAPGVVGRAAESIFVTEKAK